MAASHKILPLALAKITITPTLKKEYPVVVEKLIKYQLECAEVEPFKGMLRQWSKDDVTDFLLIRFYGEAKA